MSDFITPGGKTISTYICPQTAHVKVKLEGGGILPEVLIGIYNSEVQTKKEKEKVEKKTFVKSLSNNEEK